MNKRLLIFMILIDFGLFMDGLTYISFTQQKTMLSVYFETEAKLFATFIFFFLSKMVKKIQELKILYK